MSKRFVAAMLTGIVIGLAVERVRLFHPNSDAHRVLYYIDPMHPSYRSSKPGKAPDCGMDLQAVYADAVSQALSTPEADRSDTGVVVSPSDQRMYGIKLARVTRDPGRMSLRVFGRVAADETRVYRVNIGTDGYVRETHDDAVGNHVRKDQRLAVVYSPEFLAVEGGYLSANERTPPQAKETSAAFQNGASAQARADRLRNLGMSDAQIDELTASRKINEDVYVVSPADGFILSRNVSPGLRFERQREFYTIADLSRVWIIAEVFGKDVQSVRPGGIARVTRSDTGEAFDARISDVLPEVDPGSHAYKVRLETANPGYKLRPDMFVDVDIALARPSGLTVPADAVIQSGATQQVFVQVGPERFARRVVEVGWRADDQVQILRGLSEDDIVVSQGTFLIDSESRLQASVSTNGAAQSTPKQEDHREN